jgi:hypothetical protein
LAGAVAEVRRLQVGYQNKKGQRALFSKSTGGEGGIRTRGGFYPSHAFQACDLNHSSTSPEPTSLTRVRSLAHGALAHIVVDEGKAALFIAFPALARVFDCLFFSGHELDHTLAAVQVLW